MGILNITPDSFSDGGRYSDVDAALAGAERMIAEGAAMIDVGGESTRPGSARVDQRIEIDRVVPVIEAIAKRFDVPISIDTSKSTVAEAAINAGAEIINDISGLRFDERIAEAAVRSGSGLVLMHSRGEFETMHSQPPADDILTDVEADLRRAIATAVKFGVERPRIALDIGIGFGKTPEQNLELIAKVDRIASKFAGFPMLVGASRKSFIGQVLGAGDPGERLYGSLAAAVVAAMLGARIIRVHDVRQTVEALKITSAILAQN